MNRLPKVILSSVIRSSNQGESHGGVYIVDLNNGRFEQVLDWNDASISWEGRGGDRGLRGIAFHDNHIYIAASDEIFIYDKTFKRIGSFINHYLKHCHEIFINGNHLYITSTGFDSILVFDLSRRSFNKGYCIRLGNLRKKLSRKLNICIHPRLEIFDPNSTKGPEPKDTMHINSVFCSNETIYIAGKSFNRILSVSKDSLGIFARIPYDTHNARPFNGGILLNNTGTNEIQYLSINGALLEYFPVVQYGAGELKHGDLTEDHARQAFARGLCILEEDLIAVGSSPATVTVYRFGSLQPIQSVNLTKDVRNAIHGLEVWPF